MVREADIQAFVSNTTGPLISPGKQGEEKPEFPHEGMSRVPTYIPFKPIFITWIY